MSLTRELGEFCAALRYQHVPATVLPFVRMGFTDCFATLAAGRTQAAVQMLRRAIDPGPGPSRLLIDQGSARAPDAACINATAAHALDFDDAAQKGHISAVLVPAILAEADGSGADGRAMVTAYAAGYETWAELFRREADLHHNHSWHPTGVFGAVAAAAACARLRGLDAQQATHALAIGASQAGGLIASFGSMTKPYHAGRAAHAGVMAARLAEQGFTGASDALEHPKGLLKGISPAGRVDLISPAHAGREWRLPKDGLNIKKYPTCFATHRALDGILSLLDDHPIEPEQVRQVRVTTSRRNKSTLRFDRPDDAMQAKFSMPFAMAAAILTRRCSLLELSEDFLCRAGVPALMQRVEVLPDDIEDPRRPGEAPEDVVEVELHDGVVLRRAVDYARGGPERPLLPGELLGKFETCLAAGQLHCDARPLFQALMAVDELPGTQLIYQLAGH